MAYTDEQINSVVQKVENVLGQFTNVQNTTFCSTYIINGMKADKTAEEISEDIYKAYKPLAYNDGVPGLMNYGAANASNDMLNIVQYATGVLKQAIGDIEVQVPVEFVLGGLNGTVGAADEGEETNSNTRIRSDFIDITSNTIEYIPTEDIKYMLFFYFDNEGTKTYLERTNWLTDNSYTVAEGATHARAILSKSDNSEISNEEIETMSASIVTISK